MSVAYIQVYYRLNCIKEAHNMNHATVVTESFIILTRSVNSCNSINKEGCLLTVTMGARLIALKLLLLNDLP